MGQGDFEVAWTLLRALHLHDLLRVGLSLIAEETRPYPRIGRASELSFFESRPALVGRP